MTKKADELAAARSIKFGDTVLNVRDPNNVQPIAADVITEWRVFNDTAAVAFGTIVMHPHSDATPDLEVIVCARLRLPVGMLLDMKRMIEDATKPQAAPNKIN